MANEMTLTADNKTNIALVGFGQIAKYHLEAIKANPALELVAVCDKDERKCDRDKWNRKCNMVSVNGKKVPFYSSVSKMLSREKSIDYVVVATPPDVHSTNVLVDLKDFQGKIVLEKPLVPVCELGEQGHRAEKDSVLLRKIPDNVYVVYHWRYETEVLQLLQAIQAKRQTGDMIQSVRVHIRDNYLSSVRHSIKDAYSSKGGVWTDSGVNALSLVDLFVKLDPKSVHDVHLHHRKMRNKVPTCSECDFMVGSVHVVVKVEWSGLEEFKETVVETARHVYRLNHCKHKLTDNGIEMESTIAYAASAPEGQKPHRMSDQYCRFYSGLPLPSDGADDAIASNHFASNHTLTYNIHDILDFPATPEPNLWQRLRLHRDNREKNLDAEEVTFKWAKLLLYVFAPLLILLYWLKGHLGTDAATEVELALESVISDKQTAVILLESSLDLLVNVLSSLLGVIASFWVYRLVKRMAQKHEDELKVEENDSIIQAQYNTGEYRHEFIYNNMPVSVFYDPFYDCTKHGQLLILDHPKDKFELDNFIRFQYFSIRSAHQAGSFKNEPTIRLREVLPPADSVERGDVILLTERANYLAHMLTNRAVDYHMNGMASLRQLFEYKPTLTPLPDSKFANHIGINGLIIIGSSTNGGRYVLLPQRGKKATIAKDKLTASLATRLKTNDYNAPVQNKQIQRLEPDIVRRAMAICKEDCHWMEWFPKTDTTASASAQTQAPVSAQILANDEARYINRVIGGGRDIYEGGKPTLFYQIELPAMSLETYMNLAYEHQSGVDEIARIFVIPEDRLMIKDNLISFDGAWVKEANGKKRHGVSRQGLKLEKNLLSLFYHYANVKKENLN